MYIREFDMITEIDTTIDIYNLYLRCTAEENMIIHTSLDQLIAEDIIHHTKFNTVFRKRL